MGNLCWCGFLSYPPVIVNSNKFQSILRSSIFIGGDSLSRPIAFSMQWLVEACAWTLALGVGGKFLSASSVRSTDMVELSASTGLSWVCNFHRLRLCQGISLSVSSVGLTGVVDLSSSISLSSASNFHQLWLCWGFSLSVCFLRFQSHMFFCRLGGLWWSILCSWSQSTVMLSFLGDQSEQSK